MEKFVKDQLETSKIQPLPQTWDRIANELDRDKKVWYLRRATFAVFFLLIGIGTSFFWLGSRTSVKSDEITTRSQESGTEISDNSSSIEDYSTTLNLNKKGDSQNSEIKKGQNQIATQRISLYGDIASLLTNEIPDNVQPEAVLSERDNREIIHLANLGLNEISYRVKPLELMKIEFSKEDTDLLSVQPLANSKVNEKFTIEQSFGLTKSFYRNRYTDFGYLKDKAGIGLDIQLLGGYSISRNIDVNIGLRYVKFNWKSNVGQNEIATTDTIGTNQGYIGISSTRYATGDNIEVSSFLKYFSVPLLVNYTLMDMRKVKIGIGVGMSADWLINANVIEYYPKQESFIGILGGSKAFFTDNNSTTSSPPKISESKDVLNKFSLSYHLQAPIEFKLARNISLVASPFATYQASEFMNTEFSDRRAYAYGIRLGFKIRL
ncbi:MAG: hypothetical protein COA58_06465 [Bacteroidetes bacterium]|nr:MAG: hypothetical protein COA58_06465 [Bacteroidota bacterium]